MSFENEEVCPICLSVVCSDENAFLDCEHDVHLSCIKQVRNDECPICRGPITSSTSLLTEEELEVIQGRRRDDVESHGFSYLSAGDSVGEQRRRISSLFQSMFALEAMESMSEFMHLLHRDLEHDDWLLTPSFRQGRESIERRRYEGFRGLYGEDFGELFITFRYGRYGGVLVDLQLKYSRERDISSLIMRGIDVSLAETLIKYSDRYPSYVGYLAQFVYLLTVYQRTNNASADERRRWVLLVIERSFAGYREALRSMASDQDRGTARASTMIHGMNSWICQYKANPLTYRQRMDLMPKKRNKKLARVRYIAQNNRKNTMGYKDRSHYQRTH